MDASAIDPRRLPPTLRRLVRAVGVVDALALLGELAGRVWRVPERPDGSPRLIRLVPDAAARQRLIDEFGPGTRIDWPKMDKVTLQLRNRAIADACRSKPVTVVAREFGLTRQWVHRIVVDQRGAADAPPRLEGF